MSLPTISGSRRTTCPRWVSSSCAAVRIQGGGSLVRHRTGSLTGPLVGRGADPLRIGSKEMYRIRFVRHVVPLALALAFVGFLYLLPMFSRGVGSIDAAVRNTCLEAGAADRESCIDTLCRVAVSSEQPFERRNQAVWALGQLGDPRALPVLEQLRTGVPCPQPCRKDRQICQLEVEKAIRWCRGGNRLVKGLRRWFGRPF